MRRVYRRKRPFEYLLPFLVLVGVGVIGVLGFQLWNNLQGAKGDVYFYVAQGKAKLLQYGMKEWDTAYSGTKLLLGDAVKTSQNSRGVLQFFNGTLVRLGDDTEVTVTDITKRSDVEKIGITLAHGNIWIDKLKSEGVDQSDFQVRTSHLLASDTGSTFEIESNDVETVRVIKGAVNVQILGTESNKTSVLDTVQVGVGQEMNLDAAVLKAFQNHEIPSVLMGLSDQFKLSDWYLWNSREDQSPTDFSVHSALLPDGSTQSLQITPVSGDTQQTLVTPGSGSTQQTVSTSTDVTQFEVPVIVQPSPSVMSTDQNKMVISGTVGTGTAKVVVRETIAGNTDEYTLGKYKAGDAAFTYNVSEALGNYKAGENIYRFYAVDAAGKKSDSADVHITYNKAAVVITDTLSAPQVLKFNGSASPSASTVTVSVVKIEGSVAGAEKMFVNGYQLSKFVAGDKTWTYYANEAGGNLVPGVNNYEAYAVDPQGNKSDVTRFSITYNKPAGSTTGGTTQAATSTSTTTSTSATGSSTQSVPHGF